MRTRVLLPLLAVTAGLAAAASSAAPPALESKRAQAEQVLGEIQRIDSRLDRTVDAWNGARIRLGTIERSLGVQRGQLHVARRGYRKAQRRIATRLVELYVAEQPTTVEVLLGARNVGDLIDRVESVSAITQQDRDLADEAAALRDRLAQRERRLVEQRLAQRRTVIQLEDTRKQIQGSLAQRQQLLGRVRGEIVRIEAEERARQARLAALARARVEAERRRLEARRRAAAEAARRRAAGEAARRRAAAESAARERAARERAAAAAARAARTKAAATAAVATTRALAPEPAPATTAATTPAAPTPAAPTTTEQTTTAAPTTAAPTTAAPTTTVQTTTTAEPAPEPTPVPVAGHPEAASVALRYLGVPYVWGGDSPTAGFDCSGFVTYVFAQIGVSLPHQSAAQYGQGVPVDRSQLQPGDLVFFDGLGHDGIYIGGDQFVHAPHTGDVVKITSLSDPWYASTYVGARRV